MFASNSQSVTKHKERQSEGTVSSFGHTGGNLNGLVPPSPSRRGRGDHNLSFTRDLGLEILSALSLFRWALLDSDSFVAEKIS